MALDNLHASVLGEMERLIGVQTPLDLFHGTLRRTAQAMRSARCTGTVQVSCSDEFQGAVRASFDRDIARPLTAGAMIGERRTFQVANLGGRVEPGALRLAEEHFPLRGQSGTRLLVIEIVSHVGVLLRGHVRRYGMLDRFGRESDCCGALALLLAAPSSAAAVRHPWFDQLSAFFGPQRLATLRADTSPMRMLSAAIVHAVLQSETAVTDLLREPPPTPTHLLIVSGVVLNQSGLDELVPVGVHQLWTDGAELQLVHGASLRASPETLRYEDVGGRISVTCDDQAESSTPSRLVPKARAQVEQHLRELPRTSAAPGGARERVLAQLAAARKQVERLKTRPATWRVYSRPLLRGVLQHLSLFAPEVGLAAMLAQSGHDPARGELLRRLLTKGASGEEARAVLKQIEAEVQQLAHRDAQELLDILLSETSPLVAAR